MPSAANRPLDPARSYPSFRKRAPLYLGLAVFALSLGATYNAWDVATSNCSAHGRPSSISRRARPAGG